MDENDELLTEPEKILERRMVRRRDKAATEVRVKWVNLSEEHATWKDYGVLTSQFPSFDPWEQGSN